MGVNVIRPEPSQYVYERQRPWDYGSVSPASSPRVCPAGEADPTTHRRRRGNEPTTGGDEGSGERAAVGAPRERRGVNVNQSTFRKHREDAYVSAGFEMRSQLGGQKRLARPVGEA